MKSLEYDRLVDLETATTQEETQANSDPVDLIQVEPERPVVIAEPVAKRVQKPESATSSEATTTESISEPGPEPQSELIETQVQHSEATSTVLSDDSKPSPSPTLRPIIEIDSALSFAEAVAAIVHARTNQERAVAGVPPLAQNDELAELAEEHSHDMYERNFFSHTNPDGCNLACRLKGASLAVWAWGENIAWRESSRMPTVEEVADEFVDGWLKSQGHRENMLSKDYTQEGIGVVQANTFVFITVVFAGPQ